MKKCSIFIILIICLIFCACNKGVTEDNEIKLPEYNVGITVDCNTNLLFSKYDVKVIVDGIERDVLKHAGESTYNLTLEAGEHTLRFEKNDNSDVFGNITFSVSEDSSFNYIISCKNNEVVIEEKTVVEEVETVVEIEDKDVVIGSAEEKVRKIFAGYTETKSNFDNALDFENENLLITVFMEYSAEYEANVAVGIMFMSANFQNVDVITGEGSYVSLHYDELLSLATDDPNIFVETDLTRYNSSGTKKQPVDLYVGKVPHN